MNETLFNECTNAYYKIRPLILAKTKTKSAEFDEMIKDAITLLADNHQEFFNELIKRDQLTMTIGNFEVDDTFQVWTNARYESEFLVVPPLEGIDAESLAKILQKIYSSRATANGAIEELSPMVNRWKKIVKRMESIAKGLSLADNEWAGDAVFQVLMPKDAREQLAHFEELLDFYACKKISIDEAYETISRIITVVVGGGEPEVGDRTTKWNSSGPTDTYKKVAASELSGTKPSWKNRVKK